MMYAEFCPPYKQKLMHLSHFCCRENLNVHMRLLMYFPTDVLSNLIVMIAVKFNTVTCLL